jgi:hypothetical protein
VLHLRRPDRQVQLGVERRGGLEVGLGEAEIAVVPVQDAPVVQRAGLPQAVAGPPEHPQRRPVAAHRLVVAAQPAQDDGPLHHHPGPAQPPQPHQRRVDLPHRGRRAPHLLQHQREAHPGLGGEGRPIVARGDGHRLAQVPGRGPGVVRRPGGEPGRAVRHRQRLGVAGPAGRAEGRLREGARPPGIGGRRLDRPRRQRERFAGGLGHSADPATAASCRLPDVSIG